MNNNTYKILLVEDNYEQADPIIRILEEHNLDVEYVSSGTQAKEMVKRRTFDLILLDIGFPEGIEYGYEVCKSIKKLPACIDIPILFLTAFKNPERIDKGFEAGGVDYILKSNASVELMHRVKVHLNMKSQKHILQRTKELLTEEIKDRNAKLSDSNEKLEIANNNLQRLDKAKSGFLNMISHEVRTPLNGIVGMANLLHETTDDPELTELIEVLKIASERLLKLSDTALIITELDAGHKLSKETININDLIRGLVSLSEKSTQNQGLSFSVEFVNEELFIDVERRLVEQALTIVIDNAIKYSKNDNGNIKIKTYKDNGQTYIECVDNGQGFPIELLDNSFELFELGKPHTDNNIGLGLKVCKLITDIHSGEIKLNNLETGGASVSLVF